MYKATYIVSNAVKRLKFYILRANAQAKQFTVLICIVTKTIYISVVQNIIKSAYYVPDTLAIAADK